jgi:antitoxin MazE
MSSTTLKVARIGNSRGVRLPARVLRRYRIGDAVVMEERSDGILLRPAGPASRKLPWEETAREMASAHEGWSAWDATSADGLEDLPWVRRRGPKVAETAPGYRASPKRRRGR